MNIKHNLAQLICMYFLVHHNTNSLNFTCRLQSLNSKQVLTPLVRNSSRHLYCFFPRHSQRSTVAKCNFKKIASGVTTLGTWHLISLKENQQHQRHATDIAILPRDPTTNSTRHEMRRSSCSAYRKSERAPLPGGSGLAGLRRMPPGPQSATGLQ